MNVLRRSSGSRPGFSGKKHRGFQRRPSFETLERRALLAATGPGLSIGMNITGSIYYNGEYMWANAMEQSADQWYPTQLPASGFPYGPYSLPSGVAMPAMDSNGYPIGLGGLPAQGYCLFTFTYVYPEGPYPTGTYTLTFDGSGTVDIRNGNQPDQVFSQSGGLGSPHNVNIVESNLGIVVAITQSDPSDYVRNIRLVMPGLQQSYQSNPFNPQFLSALEPFSTVRLVAAMLPDNSATTIDGQSGPLTWAERTPPSYVTQATPSGMSVEYMVQLCNILNENMWVTMPVNADSEYVTNFAQYVEQNLNPGLKVYVEYGNEVWNAGFGHQYNYVMSYATANNESFEYATADLTADCWNLWRQVFAGQENRMVRVVATQFSWPALLTQELTRLIATSSPSDPDHGFDVVSAAPYFTSLKTSSYNASTTVTQIESDFMADINGEWKQELQAFMATVAPFEAQLGRSIPLDMYEGGVGIVAPAGASWWNAYLAAQTDPGMSTVMDAYLNALSAAGVQSLNYLCFNGTPTQYGEWGSIEYLGQPSSLTPKYNALVGFTSLGSSGLPSTMTAGTPAQVTITVYNPNGTVDTGFTGMIQFSGTDTQELIQPYIYYSFTAADQGVHTFTVTLKSAGTQSLSVIDLSDRLVITQSDIVVQPAAATRLFVISGLPTNVYSGLASSFEVAAYDPYWNIATGYTGTIDFTSSDPGAGLPSNYTFTSADAGIHSFSVLFSALGSQTITATDSTTPTIAGSASTTVNRLVAQRDTTTQGTWTGTYGSQGFDYVGTGSFLPSDATVTVSGSAFTWASNTTDPRAVQQVGSSARIASGWSSTTSFTVNVNFTDNQLHNLSLYFLDWDAEGRVEQVQLTNAATGAVLDTETVSSFQGGVYLDWPVSGNVLVTITRESGTNAVLSGIFLGHSAAGPLVSEDTTTQGNWMGNYGSQGVYFLGTSNFLPSYATVTVSSNARAATWTNHTIDPRALQQGGSSDRTAAYWYSTTSFTVDVNLTDNQLHYLALYFLDWDAEGRVEQVQLTNAATGAVLDTETVSSFQGGVYLDWRVSGNVLVTITRQSGANAVLSGIFLSHTASGSFVGENTTTQGNWIGTYGSQGYDLVGNGTSLPSYAAVTVVSSGHVWTNNTTDPRALENVWGTRRAVCWFSPTSFTVDVNLTDNDVHYLSLYFLDWDTTARLEQVQLSNASTGQVLDTETVSSFHGGVYLVWAVSGNVVIQISNLGGPNAVLSGIFLDAAP
jgi:hypothetical protein